MLDIRYVRENKDLLTLMILDKIKPTKIGLHDVQFIDYEYFATLEIYYTFNFFCKTLILKTPLSVTHYDTLDELSDASIEKFVKLIIGEFFGTN